MITPLSITRGFWDSVLARSHVSKLNIERNGTWMHIHRIGSANPLEKYWRMSLARTIFLDKDMKWLSIGVEERKYWSSASYGHDKEPWFFVCEKRKYHQHELLTIVLKSFCYDVMLVCLASVKDLYQELLNVSNIAPPSRHSWIRIKMEEFMSSARRPVEHRQGQLCAWACSPRIAEHELYLFYNSAVKRRKIGIEVSVLALHDTFLRWTQSSILLGIMMH